MSEEERLLIKYSRLSLEDSDTEESNSIKNQKKLIDDYVEEREDLKSLNSLELWDDGYTGTNFNRPGIKKFFELLKKNKVACLLVKDFSRFTRDYIELGNYVEQIFPFMDVRFISINDGYDSAFPDSNSSLEVPFKGILNDLYSKDISMKVKAAKRQMIKEGRVCSGSYPFGYRKAEKGKNSCEMPYEIDEEAGEVVRLIFKLALDGKKNIEIARELNKRGCLTPGMFKRKNGSFGYGLKDGETSIWDSAKVLTVLRDERYTGTLIVGRYRGMGVGSGKIEQLPEDMWFCKENGMPAIIPRETFELVRNMRPVQRRGKYQKEHHILYRKVRCGCCGRFLYFKPSEYGEQYHSFFCKQPHLRTDSQCFRGYIKERELLDMLSNLIRVQIRTAAAMKRESCKKVKAEEQQQAQKRLKGLEREIELKKHIKAQDYSAYKAGEISREEFLEKKANLQKNIEVCQQEIEVIRNTVGKEQEDKEDFVEKFGEYQESFQLNREMIEKLVEVIWVYDTDRVKIDLK